MELMGKANWWLPSGLDRLLPNISVERSPALQVAVMEELRTD
jgi:uncharacterized membrane protein YdfJ with MMPL/SSD domain